MPERICSRYRVHRDVYVDVIREVAHKNLGRGCPGSPCCCCVRTETRVEAGRKRGCNDQTIFSKIQSKIQFALGRWGRQIFAGAQYTPSYSFLAMDHLIADGTT